MSGSNITLKDIADAMGVSSMTVSMALRDDPQISVDRRKLIQETARKMGYRPNAMAQAMAHQRWSSAPHPICAELAWINHWQNPKQLRAFREFDLYWQGASSAAEKAGFRLEEFVVSERLPYARLEKVLLARNIHGILIPPHGGAAVTHPEISSMDWSRFSVVRFGYSIPNFPAYVVAGNYTQSLMLAFSAIWKRGYHRIGFVCHWRPGTRGKAGFLLAQSDVAPEYRLPILELDIKSTGHQRKLHRWIQEYLPDAILTEVAEMANMLKELGYKVPGDIGLAATSVLDGNSDAGIYLNSEEIGRTAIETLIHLIHQHKTGFPQIAREVLVDAHWRDGSMLPSR